jgi:serine phosphatase RsbU (regulator of sigma subunit)
MAQILICATVGRVNDGDIQGRSGPAAGGREQTIRLLDMCMDSSRLFSLHPDEVLAETSHLFGGLLPDAQVTVVPTERHDRPGEASLEPGPAELFRRARDEGHMVTGPDGLAVPLLADGRREPVGVVLLTGSDAELPEQAATLVDFIAARAAVALDHALQHETQYRIARQLQQRLLPQDAPPVEGLEFGVLFRSRTEEAEVGGDFIDFLSLSPRQAAVTIGDVSGKGIGVAATTVMAKYALRALMSTLSWPTWPGEALRDLHNALQGQLDPDMFLTAAIGTIDAQRGTIALASAGHPSPFIVRADGTVERPLLLTAPAIALVDYSELDPYPTERITVQPGDTVIFHTDGIGDLRDDQGRFYEEERMAAALADLRHLPPSALVERLYDDAVAYSAVTSVDDIALVAVRLTALPR